MTVTFTDIRKFRVVNGEDDLGTLSDLYLDERDFRAVHAVIDAGGWFTSDKVLVRADHLRGVDFESRTIATDLTKADIENAPSADTEQTVDEEAADRRWAPAAHHPVYSMIGSAPMLPTSFIIFDENTDGVRAHGSGAPVSQQPSTHLRSARDVVGYTVGGSDGDIGTVADLVFSQSGWKLTYFAVDTGKWLPGRVVVVAPSWTQPILWGDRRIEVGMTRDAVKASPPLDDLRGLERGYEADLARYYGFPVM